MAGSLGVRDSSQSGAPAQVTLSSHAQVTGDVLADLVHVRAKSVVAGQVKGNTLDIHSNASLSQPPVTSLALPLPDITPPIPPVQPGTQAVIVAGETTQILAAGSFAEVNLLDGSKLHPTVLRLWGGLYQLRDLKLGSHSRLECTAACEVRIQERAQGGDKIYLGPVPGVGRPAKDLLIFAKGSNAAFALGEEAALIGHVVAPSGTVSFGAKSKIEGVLIGRAVIVGPQASLTVADPLSPPSADAGPLIDALRDSGAAPRDLPGSVDAPRPDVAPPDRTVTPDAPQGTPIGPDGGVVTSADGKATLEIPAGALSTTVYLRLMPVTSPPSGNVDTAYELLPAGTTFAKPAKLTISYDPAKLSGAIEANLALGEAVSNVWQVVAYSKVDQSQHQVSGMIDGAGVFGVVPSVCGDGRITGVEQCEGSNLNGQTCLSLGCPGGGTLSCKSDCSFDTSLCCTPTTCAAQGKNCGSLSDGCGGTLDCGSCSSPQTCGGGGVPNVCGCTPTTCAAQGKNCGSVSDGCGATLDCGTCVPPQTCGGGGTAGVCGCTPTTCTAQGKNCGSVPDGCGAFLDCGTCSPPQSCGGSGTPNICGCTPTTCVARGKNCGAISDGCGGTLDCGSCAAPQSCGGGGAPNVCGCTPTTCAAQLAGCGTISDGCGGTLDCGACAPPQSCGGSGTPNVCGCTPLSCTLLGKNCGSVDDGCGGFVDCGTCTPPETCGGGGTSNMCGCTPTTCAAQGKNCGSISDGCGGSLSCGTCTAPEVCGGGGVANVCGQGLPPDPSTVAPPIDQGVATTVLKANAFLYSGASPVQLEVAPSAIDALRAAVIRGRVLDTQGSSKPGVKITILKLPELGHTLSRADGYFDMVVNGGDPIVVQYELAGHIPSQRQVRPEWQGYKVVDDVVMVPLDAQVTSISSLGTTMQVARGTASTDPDGTRQATLLVPAGTAATMKLPDGTIQPLSTMNLRLTELTVGANGPARMPAELPPNIAYTYAVEISADEAISAGATQVDLSSPVVAYVENFLDFPVGIEVPLGYYDRTKGYWVPWPNGRIVKVLSVTSGLADLDIDGSGQPASAASLAALGISTDEQTKLAVLYQPGQSLWRMPVLHFSPVDANWAPWANPYLEPEVEPPSPEEQDPCAKEGSIIECQNQVLGESVPIAGTPFTLNYRSSRAPGRSDASRVKIWLSGASLDPTITRLDLVLEIGGRLFKQSFSPAPYQWYTFTWDGRDVYGRVMQGKQNLDIRVGYVFGGQYSATSGRFGSPGTGSPLRSTRTELISWRTQSVSLGTWDARGAGLGGWTLDVAHSYDPRGKLVHLGSGGERVGSQMHVYSRGPTPPNGQLNGVAFDGQGNLFLSTNYYYYAGGGIDGVYKFSREGVMTLVAGGGSGGDGGPATQAQLKMPYSLAVDGSGNLYIEESSGYRIRKVGPDGIISTVAGTGVKGSSGDGGPASAAQITPWSLAVDTRGNIYIGEDIRVRKVDTDGMIRTVAGGCYGFYGDLGPATAACIGGANDIGRR